MRDRQFTMLKGEDVLVQIRLYPEKGREGQVCETCGETTEEPMVRTKTEIPDKGNEGTIDELETWHHVSCLLKLAKLVKEKIMEMRS